MPGTRSILATISVGALGKCIAGLETDRLPDRSLSDVTEPADLDQADRRRRVLKREHGRQAERGAHD